MENYELVRKDAEWKFRQFRSERTIRNFETKDDGLEFSTKYVRKHGGSLKIKTELGKVQEERTYPRSADPRRSPG